MSVVVRSHSLREAAAEAISLRKFTRLFASGTRSRATDLTRVPRRRRAISIPTKGLVVQGRVALCFIQHRQPPCCSVTLTQAQRHASRSLNHNNPAWCIVRSPLTRGCRTRRTRKKLAGNFLHECVVRSHSLRGPTGNARLPREQGPTPALSACCSVTLTQAQFVHRPSGDKLNRFACMPRCVVRSHSLRCSPEAITRMPSSGSSTCMSVLFGHTHSGRPSQFWVALAVEDPA